MRNNTFFVTHMVREDKTDIIKEELDFFIGNNYIVTFHLNSSQEVNDVWIKY